MEIFQPTKPDRTATVQQLETRPLSIDLFYPESRSPGPLPTVVFIHGGGWKGGSRQQFYWHARDLSNLGFLGACIEYRLSGEALFPAAVGDCLAAIDELIAQKSDLHVDNRKMAVVGSSAGAHLAASVGTDCSRGQAAVPYAVAIHGIFDLPKMHKKIGQSIYTSFIGSSYADVPDLWRAASPIFCVNDKSAEFLLFHDPDDENVPFSQTQEFAEKLIECGRNVCFYPTPGSGHGFIYNRTDPHTENNWPIITNWLSQRLQT